jgi:glycosyltransferase involved in cell wall biosynthesis
MNERHLRLLHVVTLVAADGAFGGPTAVALDQALEQRRRGHDTTVVALGRGFGNPLPSEVSGVPVRLYRPMNVFPGLGFAGMTSLRLLGWAWRSVPRFDVVHVHLARDLVTLPLAEIAVLRGVPLVLQPHGMIDAATNRLATWADVLAVRRVLSRAGAILGLVDDERDDLEGVAGRSLPYLTLGNGVTTDVSLPPDISAEPGPVLCVGRLHARKRPLAFVRAAAVVRAEGHRTPFWLVGPDEGELPAVQQLIGKVGLQKQVSYLGARPRAEIGALMRQASVVVQPTERERFGLVLVEAMALGVPVVCTDTCGIASHIRHAGAGLVTNGSTREIGHAVARLLSDPQLRYEMGQRGIGLVRDRYSIEGVVDRLEGVYDAVLGLAG